MKLFSRTLDVQKFYENEKSMSKILLKLWIKLQAIVSRNFSKLLLTRNWLKVNYSTFYAFR